ncbi:hypothetical protein CMI37_15670 [Candidatus Pacearchaeota archaeon]|jgi:RNase adaptor protein for sRNA GlmZ degradation|nr:hypothetical protein [Candidatus Pacearchaeota archaeon]|tara:strand:+ start:1566 stop:1937 length:372 start_codon:yes stop_codon:yes gene_type:complete
MRIDIESFSFIKDRCHAYDYVLDARTLDLRGNGIIWMKDTGLDQHVAEIAAKAPEFKTIVAMGVGFVMIMDAQQRDTIHIGIGCHHGRHRSVSIAEGLVERLNQLQYYDVHVYHRQLDKAGKG